MPVDKPIVAITAAQIAAASKAASATLTAVPGEWPEKNIVLAVLAGVGVAGGIVVSALTLGLVPAIVAGVPAVATYVAGLYSASPTAVAKFGGAAK